jgi:hypothetical protein
MKETRNLTIARRVSRIFQQPYRYRTRLGPHYHTSLRYLASPDINIGGSYAPNVNNCYERALLLKHVERIACRITLPTLPPDHCYNPQFKPST